MTPNQEKFTKLWQHITGTCRKAESECMLLLKAAFMETLAPVKPNIRPLITLSDRIGKNVGFTYHRHQMLPEVTGGYWRMAHYEC
jgi:hypothetical protein